MRRSTAVIVLVAVASLTLPVAAARRDGERERPSSAAATAPGTSCSPPFRQGRWPAACWRPYGSESPFNQRLPDAPRISPGSERMVQRLTERGGPSPLSLGVADTGSDWDHPTYYARSSDPLYRVHCYQESWGRCEIEGTRIRIPRAARPAGGGDAHMTVIDPEHRWEYDLYKVRSKPRRGGVLVARWGGRTPATGDGLGSDATAAHFGLLAGVIRVDELQAGRIRHALFVRADCDSGTFVYPASGVGAPCADRAGAPPEGARFQLALSDAEIDELDVPGWKRTIIRAMAEYGFFIGDTGGTPWDIVLESGSTFTSFGRPDPWARLAQSTATRRSASGRWFLDLASGIDWTRRLRVIDPCVTRRTC